MDRHPSIQRIGGTGVWPLRQRLEACPDPCRRAYATRALGYPLQQAVMFMFAVVASGALNGFAGAAVAEANENASAQVARMDELWAARDRLDALREFIDVGNQTLALDPESYEAAWRVAHAYWWVAYRSEERTLKKGMATKAMDAAKRAIGLNPKRVEGQFIYTVALGEYGSSIGIITAIREGLGGKFERGALKAYELDRDFDGGGPMIALGRFYYMLPWPLRDLKKSRRYLEELRSRHPEALIGRVYLAETYYALGDKDEARAELELVLKTELPPAADPDGPFSKQLAAEILRKWRAS